MKRAFTEVHDDLDGSLLALDSPPLEFAFDGRRYEIDLSPEHAEGLRAVFARYARHATEVAPPAPPAAPTRAPAVRAWAQAQGLPVAPHGRISSDVLDRYRAAHA